MTLAGTVLEYFSLAEADLDGRGRGHVAILIHLSLSLETSVVTLASFQSSINVQFVIFEDFKTCAWN